MVALFTVATALPGIAQADAAGEKRQVAAYVAAEGQSGRSMALEPGALAAAHGRVKRAGPLLTIDLNDGKTGVRLEDRTDCKAGMGASDCQQFFLVAALPRRHAYIVVKARYEGTGYILIDDRTGKGLAFPGPPQFATKGGRILVLNGSALAEGPSIEIWNRRADGSAAPEWIHPLGHDKAAAFADPRATFDIAPQSMKLARWTGDRIDLEMRYPAIYERKPFALRARIERIKGAWYFVMLKPK
jgi:hypothetical protein